MVYGRPGHVDSWNDFADRFGFDYFPDLGGMPRIGLSRRKKSRRKIADTHRRIRSRQFKGTTSAVRLHRTRHYFKTRKRGGRKTKLGMRVPAGKKRPYPHHLKKYMFKKGHR